jgi:hypothetical protein
MELVPASADDPSRVTGGITRTGDEMVRTALYEAANVLAEWPLT